jgi:hypothetical protein
MRPGGLIARPEAPGHRSPLNYYVPGLCVVCLGGMTLPTTGTGRRPEGRRGARLGLTTPAE